VLHGYQPDPTLSRNVTELPLQQVLNITYIFSAIPGIGTTDHLQACWKIMWFLQTLEVAIFFSFEHFRVVLHRSGKVFELITTNPTVAEESAFREVVSHISGRYLKVGAYLSLVLSRLCPTHTLPDPAAPSNPEEAQSSFSAAGAPPLTVIHLEFATGAAS
jgi:hypothetical protein